MCQERNVKSELRCDGIGTFLAWGQEVEQECRETSLSERSSDGAIARATAATAAAVNKHDEAARVCGSAQVAIDHGARYLDLHWPGRQRRSGAVHQRVFSGEGCDMTATAFASIRARL
jgi:hypothetical protein